MAQKGYMSQIKKCCPAQELMSFVQSHYLDQIRSNLRLKEEFIRFARETREQIATQRQGSSSLDNKLTFVGIHNRRTVMRKVALHFEIPIYWVNAFKMSKDDVLCQNLILNGKI